MRYDGIVFDKDGVLVDSPVDGSMEWLKRARVDAAHKLGYQDFSIDDADDLVHLASNGEVERKFLGDRGLSYTDLKEIERMRGREKMRRVDEGMIGLMDGVEELLEKYSDEIPLAVISNATMESLEHTLKELGIRSYFDFVMAPDTDNIRSFYDRRKPNAFMLERAMEESGMTNPVMVGDSGSDIKTAQNAGADSVLLDIYGKKVEVEPDYRITGMAELERIVGNGSN